MDANLDSENHFDVILNSDGTYSFRTKYNQYISPRADGWVETNVLDTWEKFNIYVDDKYWCVRSIYFDKFMGAGTSDIYIHGNAVPPGSSSSSNAQNEQTLCNDAEKWIPMLVSSLIDVNEYNGLLITL